MKIKGFKIDSEKQEITEVEYDSIFGSSYEYLWRNFKSGCITTAGSVIKDNQINTLFVDDEGLLTGIEDINYGFSFENDGNSDTSFLIGNGILEGSSDEGESISSNLTLQEVEERVIFKTFTREQIAERLEKGFQIISFNNFKDNVDFF